MKIIIILDDERYEIDTNETPNILNSKQIELIANMLNIPKIKKCIGAE